MRLNGLIAAPFTPMNQDGSLRLAQIEAFASRLKADGVKGVFVCGPCRIPLQTLTDMEIQELKKDLVQIDFFKRIKS